MGGIPNFNLVPEDPNQDPDFIKNPYTNNANPYAQTKLIKDLLRFSPDEINRKEAELVDIIDNAINSNKNVFLNMLKYFCIISFPNDKYMYLFLFFNKN